MFFLFVFFFKLNTSSNIQKICSERRKMRPVRCHKAFVFIYFVQYNCLLYCNNISYAKTTQF